MELKKVSYVLLLALFIGAAVLVFLGKENFSTSLKPLLEGLTVGLGVMCLVALILLFRKNTFKNALLFEIVNIVTCALAIVTLIIYVRDEQLDKTSGENIGFLVLICVAIFLTGLVLLDDVMNLGIGMGKKVDLQN
jgi:hypothetical protein